MRPDPSDNNSQSIQRIGTGGQKKFFPSLRPDLLSPYAAYRYVSTQPAIAITFLYYALLITLGFGGAMLGPAIPTLAHNTGASTEAIAWSFTAKAFGGMAGAFFLSRLYDRFPGHRLMAVALAILLPAYALTPFVARLGTLFPLLLLAGICEATLHVGFNTLLVRLHRDRVAPFMNGLHFAFGIGATASPLLLGLSFKFGGGIVWPFLGVVVVMLLHLPFLFRLPTPERQITADVKTTIPPPHRLLPMLLALLFFFYAGVEGSLSGWVYSYALDLKIADAASSAWLTSLFWGGMTLGRLAGVILSRRFAPRHILLADLLGGIAVLCWIVFFGKTFYMLAIGVTAYGFAIASIFPTIMAFAGIRMTMTGNVTGWFFVGASLGGMLFPWLVGQFFTTPGPQAMLIVAGGSLTAALGIYAWTMGLERRRG